MSAPVVLGVVIGAFGVRGQVRIKTFTESPLGLATYGPLLLGDSGKKAEISDVQPLKGDVVAARLAGVSDRDQAAALKGTELRITRDQLGASGGADEFFHVDLIGLPVQDAEGQVWGHITAVENYGAGDLLDIRLAQGGTLLLPFTRDQVPDVDLENGFVVALPLPLAEDTAGEDTEENSENAGKS